MRIRCAIPIDRAGMDAAPNDPARVLIHDGQDPVGPQRCRLAPEQILKTGAVVFVAGVVALSSSGLGDFLNAERLGKNRFDRISDFGFSRLLAASRLSISACPQLFRIPKSYSRLMTIHESSYPP